MNKSRYSDSQILAILNQAEAGTPVSALCREHGTSSATFYKWRAKHAGMDASLMARLKQLESFHSLKRIATPKEVAEVAVFLSSKESGFIHGSCRNSWCSGHVSRYNHCPAH